MAIKLLIADVDGTLVTSKKTLTPRTCDAVARLRAAGVDFTITSGRPPRGMAMLIEPLQLTAPVAAFNGGMYVKSDLTTVLAQKTITRNVADEAIDFMLHAGLDVWVYQHADWFVRQLDAPRVARESGTVGFPPTKIDDLHAVLDAPVKIVGVSMDLALVARCEAELSARLGPDVSAVRSQPYYLDITHPEANKGMVVREAARILKIPLEQIAAIGDMSNDISMLRLAGLSIAMGNASPEVQRVARHVTTSNEQEGFTHAVDAFILGKPPLARSALGLPPRTRACLFGLEGVLTQTSPAHAQAWKRLFDHYLQERDKDTGQAFAPFDADADFRLHFEGKRPFEAVRSFLASRNIELPETTVRALVEREGALLADLLRQAHVQTHPGSVRYLRAVRAAGLRTAVVSSNAHCEDVLRSADLADLFDAHIDGRFGPDEQSPGRPAPDLYLAAAQAVGVAAEEAAVIESGGRALEAVRTGHFGYVVDLDGTGHRDEPHGQGADVVVSDLTTLLAA